MKVIVTGATGFLGGHLVALLEQHGIEIIALGRNQAFGNKLQSQLTRFKSADLSELSQLDAAFETADVVFHCAALSSAWGDQQAFYQANVLGTQNVLACCEKYAIKRLIYVSSTSVYFDYQDKFNLKPDQALNSNFVNAYAESKRQAELCLLNNTKQTEIVIIRPRGIIGDGDTSIMPRILKIADKGFFPLIRGGQALVDVTYVKNVAHALYLAAITPNIAGRCYNISNQEPLSVKQLLERVLKQRKQRIYFIPVHYRLIYSLAWIMERIAKIFALPEPRLTCYGIGLLATSQTLDISAAQQELGYQPLYSLDEGIKRYLAWEQTHA